MERDREQERHRDREGGLEKEREIRGIGEKEREIGVRERDNGGVGERGRDWREREQERDRNIQGRGTGERGVTRRYSAWSLRAPQSELCGKMPPDRHDHGADSCTDTHATAEQTAAWTHTPQRRASKPHVTHGVTSSALLGCCTSPTITGPKIPLNRWFKWEIGFPTVPYHFYFFIFALLWTLAVYTLSLTVLTVLSI